MKHYLGIDIGGTSIKVGVVDENGALQSRRKLPLPADWEAMGDTIEALFHEASAETPIAGVGFATPGTADSVTGIISGIPAPTVSYIFGRCFFDFSARLGVPVSLEQDANCAALGEYWVGNAQGCRTAMTLVLGSGLGGCILLDGRVHHGAHTQGGDTGYAYRTADPGDHSFSYHIAPVSVEQQYRERTGRFLTIPQMYENRDSDPDARAVYDRFLDTLANTITILQYTVDPDFFLLGGGVSEWELLIPEVERRLAELQAAQGGPLLPRVTRCRHRNSANIIGAVYHLRQQHGI